MNIHFTERMKAIASLFPKSKTAADIGADHGLLSIYLARENLADIGNISYICDDFGTHLFSERFDVIYSSLTMMHFEDKRRIIKKVSDLLNNGGIFCLSIDKNQSDHIDMGTRKLKIYPDTPENITELMLEVKMDICKTFETENAYIIVSRKR